MASCGIFRLFSLCVWFCIFVEKAHSFVELVCVPETIGELGHQSMLSCTIKLQPGIKDVTVQKVIWRKKTANTTPPVLFFNINEKFDQEPGYMFAEPSWNENNMNVSLLITSTKLADEGEYTCDVLTDSGFTQEITSLKVTAKYNEPRVNIVDEKDIPHADKALICRAQGGRPAGRLRWFDENKTEWTKSAELEVKENDGLFDLSSKLPLLPGSTFSEYTCVVYNSSGGKEHEIVFHLKTPAENIQSPDSSSSKIVAPVLVIGSLIVGLLIALLIYRRRSNQFRRPSATPFLASSQECPTEEPDEEGHQISSSQNFIRRV